MITQEYLWEPDSPQKTTNVVGLNTIEVQAFKVWKFKNVRLIGPHGIPVDHRGRILVEPISLKYLPAAIRGTINQIGMFGFFVEYLRALFPALRLRSEAAVELGFHLYNRAANWRGQGPVFGHWLGEQLPQIHAYLAEQSLVHFKLLINPSPASWQLETLEMLGIQASKILVATTPGVQVRELAIASLRNVHSQGSEFDPIARRQAGELLRSASKLGGAARDTRRVFDLRHGKGEDRRILNYAEVKLALENRGYCELKTQGSLEEQVAEMLDAEILVAISGSGIFKLMFSNSPMFLVEIEGIDSKARDVFFRFSKEIGVRRLVCSSEHGLHGSISVNLRELEKLLEIAEAPK